jgi:hypothetical protein
MNNRLNGAHFGGPDGKGRNGQGQFAAGNPGGPGRPRRAAERDYLRALTDECPPETWRAICRRAAADAVRGDAKAREWLSRYLLGSPADLPTLQALAQEQEGRA